MAKKLKNILKFCIPIALIIIFSIIVIPLLTNGNNSKIKCDYVYKTADVTTNTSPYGSTATLQIEFIYMGLVIDHDTSLKVDVVLDTNNGEINNTYTIDKFEKQDMFENSGNLDYSRYIGTVEIAKNDLTSTTYSLNKLKSVKYSTDNINYKDAQKATPDILDNLKEEASKYNRYMHGTRFGYIALAVGGYAILLFIAIASIATIFVNPDEELNEQVSNEVLSKTDTNNTVNYTIECEYCGTINDSNAKTCSNCRAQLKKPRNKNKSERNE